MILRTIITALIILFSATCALADQKHFEYPGEIFSKLPEVIFGEARNKLVNKYDELRTNYRFYLREKPSLEFVFLANEPDTSSSNPCRAIPKDQEFLYISYDEEIAEDYASSTITFTGCRYDARFSDIKNALLYSEELKIEGNSPEPTGLKSLFFTEGYADQFSGDDNRLSRYLMHLRADENARQYEMRDSIGSFLKVRAQREGNKIVTRFYIREIIVMEISVEAEGESALIHYVIDPFSIRVHSVFANVEFDFDARSEIYTEINRSQYFDIPVMRFYEKPGGNDISYEKFLRLFKNSFQDDIINSSIAAILGYCTNILPETQRVADESSSQRIINELELILIRLRAGRQIDQSIVDLNNIIKSIRAGEIQINDLRED